MSRVNRHYGPAKDTEQKLGMRAHGREVIKEVSMVRP